MKVAGEKAQPEGESHPPVTVPDLLRAPAGRMTKVPTANLMRPAGAHTTRQPIDPVGAPGFSKLPTGYCHARLRREEVARFPSPNKAMPFSGQASHPACHCRLTALGRAAEVVNEEEMKKPRELLRLSRGQPESGQLVPSSIRHSLGDSS